MDAKEFKAVYDRYKNMLYKIAFTYMKNQPDTEDVLQEVFMKRIYSAPKFESMEHEKCWMIRVTVNICKNALMTFWNRNRAAIDDVMPVFYDEMEEDKQKLLDEVLELPTSLKAPIYLHYYEGYSCKEIAEILNVKESTIKMRMKRGRDLLKLNLMEEGVVHEFG